MGEGKGGWLDTGLGAKKGANCRNYREGRCTYVSPPRDCAGDLAKKKGRGYIEGGKDFNHKGEMECPY